MRMKTFQMVLMLGLILSVVPAFADGVTVTGTSGCTSSVVGLTSTIDFGSGSPNATDPAGYATYATPYFNQGSNPDCGGNWLGLSGGQTTTITFSEPIDYFGTAWGTPDGYNSLTIYDGLTALGSYTGGNVSNYYMNFLANPGYVFTSVVMSSGGCCFEMDNQSYQLASVPEPSTTGLIGVDLSMPLLLAAYVALRRRRLHAPATN
jgi:hypothetical protein